MRAEIGHSRPPFALQDQDDRNATPLDDEVIGDPAVIMFDRNPPGGAPDISAGLRRAVGRLQSRLEDRPGGMIVPIFVISLYSVAENAGLADAEGITFRLLSDPHGEVFALYGVDPAVSPVDPGSNADVDPASLVLDPNGRVVPEIEKAFGYSPSKREDYRIACYDVAEGGALPAHRDNPTESTRHRRFTVSINLNNASFEGGELVFREWSDHLYDIDEGMAVAWSCSLLHEVMPITKGRRFILGTHLFG